MLLGEDTSSMEIVPADRQGAISVFAFGLRESLGKLQPLLESKSANLAEFVSATGASDVALTIGGETQNYPLVQHAETAECDKVVKDRI
jgi:hypothetical protein